MFRPYPKIKDSGVEWLGKIPEHWNTSPLKKNLSRNEGGVWGDDPDGENNTTVLRSTEQTVDGHWIIEDPAIRKLSTSDRLSALLREGDLLITKSSGSSLHIGKTSLVTRKVADLECCYSNFMQRITPTNTLLSKFVWYFLNSQASRAQLDYLSNTTTGLANLNGGMIGSLIIGLTGIEEQRAIAAFLDRKTALIDDLIDRRERQIELLQEQRTALISRAVTKGLNPDVPMKNSGVEWIGEIPTKWTVSPIKHFVSIPVTDGPHETPEFLDEGVPFVSAEAVRGGRVHMSSMRGLISPEAHKKYAQKYLPRKKDIFMVKSGATTGKVAIVDFEDEFNVWSPLAAIRCDKRKAIPKFVFYALGSEYFQGLVQVSWSFGTQQNIGMGVIENLGVVLPPVVEQQAISTFLDRETAKIDTFVTKVQKSIDKLREYRQSLISAAITGKIDVRNWQSSSKPVEESLHA